MENKILCINCGKPMEKKGSPSWLARCGNCGKTYFGAEGCPFINVLPDGHWKDRDER